MTYYLVFRKIDDIEETPLGWRIVDRPLLALSGQEAIKNAFEAEGNEATTNGDYAATPLDSWYTETVSEPA